MKMLNLKTTFPITALAACLLLSVASTPAKASIIEGGYLPGESRIDTEFELFVSWNWNESGAANEASGPLSLINWFVPSININRQDVIPPDPDTDVTIIWTITTLPGVRHTTNPHAGEGTAPSTTSFFQLTGTDLSPPREIPTEGAISEALIHGGGPDFHPDVYLLRVFHETPGHIIPNRITLSGKHPEITGPPDPPIILGISSPFGNFNFDNPIPEPTSLALLALGGLMLARRRRQTRQVRWVAMI